MKELTLYMNTILDVTNFSHITNKSKYDLILCNDKYTVNAKSLLGILSLNLSKPVTLKYNNIETEILNKIKKFQVDK